MSIRDLIPWEHSFGIPVQYTARIGRSLESLQDDMNRLFDHLYSGAEVYTTDWDKKLPSAPSINISEDEKSIKIIAELAGMDPEQINVEVSDGFLTLKGEKKEEKSEEEKNYVRREISYGSFFRSVPLPQSADGKKAEASFKNGVLTITVPKKANTVQPVKLPIKKAA